MKAAHWVTLLLSLAFAWSGGAAHAEVYRWKDSKGQVHFGDRPDPSSPGAKKVVVPRPNLAKGLEIPPPTTSTGSTKADPDDETTKATVPAETVEKPKPVPLPKRGFAAQRQDSCQAKWAAFDASAACFGACGKSIGGGRTRNNAGCEHCDEAPMPNC